MPRKLDGAGDDGGMNRTTSLQQKQQRKELQLKRKESIEKLQAYTLKLPAAVDVAALEKAVADAEQTDVDKELIANSKRKLEEARKLQAKKEREKRIAELNKRRGEVTKELEGWVNVAPLEVDLKELGKIIEESDVLAESEGTDHIDEGLVRSCREKYSEAEAAYEGKRKEALAELERQAATVLTADPEALSESCQKAKKWGVAEDVLKRANMLLADATKRDHAVNKLQRATHSAEGAELSSLDLDLSLLRKSLEAAALAAAPAAVLVAAQRRLRAAEEAQAPRERAIKRLERVLAKPAGSLDQEAVRAAKVDAIEVFVPHEKIAKADAALRDASATQLVKDAATVSLLALAAPTQPTREQVKEFQQLLTKAPAAGVPEDVLALATTSAEEAEQAELVQNDTYSNASLCARLKAATERTATTAPAKKEATEQAASIAEQLSKTAADRASAERASVDAAVQACTAAWDQVAAADADVRKCQEDAEAARAPAGARTSFSENARKEALDRAQAAWARSEELRKAALEEEAKLHAMYATVEEAEQEAAEAAWQATKTKLEAEWAKQVADVVETSNENSKLKAQLAADEMSAANLKKREKSTRLGKAAAAKKPKKGGGCCSKPAPELVIDPAEVRMEDASTPRLPKLPLPPLVDEIAWSPLKLPSGSSHQVELLLAFALGGLYADMEICGAVATAICMQDPTFHTCRTFLLRLSDSYAAGTTSITAGSAASAAAIPARSDSITRRISNAVFGGQSRLSHSGSPGGSFRTSFAGNTTLRSFSRANSMSKAAGIAENEALSEWPGREVASVIDSATFGAIVECWLTRMAKGSRSRGGGAATATASAGDPAAAALPAGTGVLSDTISKLMQSPHIERLAGSIELAPILTALLERHFEVNKGVVDEGDAGESEEQREAAIALQDVHACVELIIGASIRTPESFESLIPIWLSSEPNVSPPSVLAGTARAFATRLVASEEGYKSRLGNNQAEEDTQLERVVLAMVTLFVKQPGNLTGFQQLVPQVFDTYLALGSSLRARMCDVLKEGGIDEAIVGRIATDDELVCQKFFWSAAGMKLFGGHPDVREPATLMPLLVDAAKQQPIIVAAFLEQAFKRAAEKGGAEKAALPTVVQTGLRALLEFVAVEHGSKVLGEVVLTKAKKADKHGVVCVGAAEAVIDAIDAGSLAAASGQLKKGMVIQAVNDVSVGSAADAAEKMKAAFPELKLAVFTPPPPADVAKGASEKPPVTLEPVRRGVLVSLEFILDACATHREVNPAAFEAWEGSDYSSALLSQYAAFFRPRLVAAKKEGYVARKADEVAADEAAAEGANSAIGRDDPEADGTAAPKAVGRDDPEADAPVVAAVPVVEAVARPSRSGGGGSSAEDSGPEVRADLRRDEAVITTLAELFIKKPTEWKAFGELVPLVFETHLALGTEPRSRFNDLLLTGALDKNLGKLIAESDDFVKAPFFWNDAVMPLSTRVRIDADYASMNRATMVGKDGRELHLYSRMLALLLRLSAHRGGSVSEIGRRTKEVLDQIERNEDQQQFLLTMIERLEERSLEAPDDFSEIDLTVLSDVAANGVQTISSVSEDGMELCRTAMTTLLQSYVTDRMPADWKQLFKDATNIAFMVKYMFRESLPIAKQKFTEALGKKSWGSNETQQIMTNLVQETLAAYGNTGIYDPSMLAEIDFLNHPEQLVELVSRSKERESRAQKEDMKLLTEITTKWMELMVEKQYPPLTPHHTQAFTVLMMSKFFEQHLRGDSKKKTKLKLKAFVAQLATGEGKSIVIAMLAIFMVKLHGLRVHVLENNAGLLQRDYAQNKPFYEKFGIKSGYDLSDPDAKIVYCLKDGINRRFLHKIVEGKLDEELGSTVLIVDEVDDLIVNERPNAQYVKKDVEKSTEMVDSYKVLKAGGTTKPDTVEQQQWDFSCAVKDYCEKQTVENTHYRIIESSGKRRVIMLDSQGNVPKVALTSPWLIYLNYALCGIEPFSETRHACLCTPYIFNKYKGIFGLTGSVGGKAELNYLSKTYHCIKFDVPRFLDTCSGNARKDVVNHGVELHSGEEAQIRRVVQLASDYYKQVPVLIITTGGAQLNKVYEALQKNEHGIPAEEVQRFAQFDEKGRSLASKWQTIIDDATKRLGGVHDSRCRVTVTDKFGGRGHDFQVVDKEANANGGMLVIATSVPDEREWIQWKGRTARQDRPGQFYVILDETVKPFSDPKRKQLREQFKKLSTGGGGTKTTPREATTNPEDLKVELLLDVSDEGIGEKLKSFQEEQALGEKLNELTEKYYNRCPRTFQDPWPMEQFKKTDAVLREILTSWTDPTKVKPADIKAKANHELNIQLE